MVEIIYFIVFKIVGICSKTFFSVDNLYYNHFFQADYKELEEKLLNSEKELKLLRPAAAEHEQVCILQKQIRYKS